MRVNAKTDAQQRHLDLISKLCVRARIRAIFCWSILRELHPEGGLSPTLLHRFERQSIMCTVYPLLFYPHRALVFQNPQRALYREHPFPVGAFSFLRQRAEMMPHLPTLCVLFLLNPSPTTGLQFGLDNLRKIREVGQGAAAQGTPVLLAAAGPAGEAHELFNGADKAGPLIRGADAEVVEHGGVVVNQPPP